MTMGAGFQGRVTRWLAMLACLIMVACIDGREEFWIRSDGSGRATIHYEIPESAALLRGGPDGIRQIIGNFLEVNAAVFSAIDYEVSAVDGRITIDIEAAFDSALELEHLKASDARIPPAIRHFVGEFKITRDGRKIDFTRTVSPGKALPGSTFLPASRFKDRRLVCIVHLPAAATTSNATRIENNGTTLVWDHPLTAGLRKPLVSQFEVEVPIPTSWIAAASLAGLLMTGVAVLGFRTLLGRRRHAR
jgi:hypothetical protein